MWWIGLLGVIIGGILTIIGRLLGDRYMSRIEAKRWKREKQAQIAGEVLEIYNELLTYSSLGEGYSWVYDLIAKVDIRKLLTDSRRLTSLIPLYFGEKIQIVWLELVVMLEGAATGQLLLEFEKLFKGEEPSKDTIVFCTKLEEIYKLFRKELDIKG